MNIIHQIELEQVEKNRRKTPKFQAGDSLRVSVKVSEGDRTRIQSYEGVCIARAGHRINKTFTVRKTSYGEGVERVFPLHSPMVVEIKVIRRGKVRRAKLYYLRSLSGKSARIVENTSIRARNLNEEERVEREKQRALIKKKKADNSKSK